MDNYQKYFYYYHYIKLKQCETKIMYDPTWKHASTNITSHTENKSYRNSWIIKSLNSNLPFSFIQSTLPSAMWKIFISEQITVW